MMAHILVLLLTLFSSFTYAMGPQNPLEYQTAVALQVVAHIQPQQMQSGVVRPIPHYPANFLFNYSVPMPMPLMQTYNPLLYPGMQMQNSVMHPLAMAVYNPAMHSGFFPLPSIYSQNPMPAAAPSVPASLAPVLAQVVEPPVVATPVYAESEAKRGARAKKSKIGALRNAAPRAESKSKDSSADDDVPPYTCADCLKDFDKKFKLTIHWNRNHKPKDLACVIEGCAKTFRLPGHLNRHVRTVHMGDKPFVCRKCGEKFGESGTCRTHERKVHHR